MSRVTRRRFLKTTAAASTTFGLFTIAGTKASGQVLGANDTIRVGVAGINGRGSAHINEFTGLDKVAVTYLIDPDTRLFESRQRQVAAKGGTTPKCVQDIRQALEDPNLDAVSVATCNHWHSLIIIWACQAGKDVYVEKPLSHNIFEGRKVVEAARKYGRVVQHGTQARSSRESAGEMAAIHSGKYGKLLVSKGYCCKSRWSIGFKPTKPAPPELDFNLWLGPAREQPFHENLVHYNWHWFWETGNGDIGNQGVHQIDAARWGIKDATLPTRVWSLGGRFLPDGPDQGETPNMLLSVYEFGDVLLVFETRGLVGRNGGPNALPQKITNEFYTSEGKIAEGKFYPNGGGDPVDVEAGEAAVTDGRAFGSFIAAVRSRKPEDINCDAEVGHYSSALCHLGNISFRLGEPARFDRQAQTLGDNRQVVESFTAIKENLQAVNIRLEETTYFLGRTLNFDPKTERFTGDEDANALLSRNYREPFVVPQQV
jgi:predicted dehydrogenase